MTTKMYFSKLMAFFLALSLLPFISVGQVTVQSNQVYQHGTDIKFGIDGPFFNNNFVDLIWMDSIPQGPNAHWDFSFLTPSFHRNVAIIHPDSAVQPLPFASDAVLDFGADGTSYFQHNADSLSLLGFKNQNDLIIPRTEREVMIKFPAALGQTHSGEYESKFTFFVGQDLMTGYIVDSVRRYNTTNYSYLFDSWGTLQTPNKQYNVIRQKVVKTTVYLADFLNRSTGQWVIKADSSFGEVTEYQFWSPDAQVPVLILQDFSNIGFATEVQWIDSISTKPASNVSLREMNRQEMRIFPNPAKDIVNVEVKEPASLYVMDLSGKTILTQWMNQGLDQINVSSLPAGIYLLVMEEGNQLLNARLIKH